MAAVKIPDIANNALPPEEREDGSFLNWSLGRLETYVDRFDLALQLLERYRPLKEDAGRKASEALSKVSAGVMPDSVAEIVAIESRRMKTFDGYCEIAARDASMTVFHIMHVIEGVRDAANKTCPSLRPHIDLPALDTALDKFKKLFPNAIRLRNGVGHSAQNAKDRVGAMANAVKLSDGNTLEFFSGSLAGDHYGLTVSGVFVGLRIAPHVLDVLNEIQGEVYAAFAGAVAASEAMKAAQQAPGPQP